jgi:hypothetical protein
LREFLQEGEECRRLTDEEADGLQGIERTHGRVVCCGTNDRARREALAQENGWLRHDQVGLEILGVEPSPTH